MTLPGTPADTVVEYIPQGTREFWWVPTIASKAAPTLAEMTAGTLLTGVTAAASGWESTSSSVDAPNFATLFTPKVAGVVTVADSSLEFYLDGASGTDLRTTMVRGTHGFIVIGDGDPPSKIDVWPVTIASAAKSPDIAKVASLLVTFSITSEPAENVTFPTV